MKFRNILLAALSSLCFYSAAYGQIVSSTTFDNYSRHLGIARPETYTGGYILPGYYHRQVMSTYLSPRCSNSPSNSSGTYCADVEVRQGTYTGGVVRVTTGRNGDDFPGTAKKTCFIWGINAVTYNSQLPNYFDEPSTSKMFQNSSDAIEPSRKKMAFISVSEPLEVPFSCQELVSGPWRSFDITYSGETYYLATSGTSSYGSMYFSYYPGSDQSITALGPGTALVLQSNGLLCNSNSWSRNNCMISRYAGWYEFGTGGELTPIDPAQCDLSGSTTIDFGIVSKKEAIGESSSTVLTLQCSKNATVNMQFIDNTLSKDGLDVGIGFGDTTASVYRQNVGKTPVQVSIVAKIKGIADSTSAGEYNFSTPLVVTYY